MADTDNVDAGNTELNTNFVVVGPGATLQDVIDAISGSHLERAEEVHIVVQFSEREFGVIYADQLRDATEAAGPRFDRSMRLSDLVPNPYPAEVIDRERDGLDAGRRRHAAAPESCVVVISGHTVVGLIGVPTSRPAGRAGAIIEEPTRARRTRGARPPAPPPPVAGPPDLPAEETPPDEGGRRTRSARPPSAEEPVAGNGGRRRTRSAQLPVEEEEEEEPATEARSILAQVFAMEGETRGVMRVNSFRAGRDHEVDVWIGPPEVDVIRASTVFPEDELPPQEEPHLLQVIFEPSPSESELKTIELPRSGKSTAATFRLKAPEDADYLEANIHVMFQNRILQSAVLRGPVIAGVLDAAAADLRIELYTGPPIAVDLDNRTPGEATLWIGGESIQILVGSDTDPRRLALSDIDQETTIIRDELIAAAKNMAKARVGIDAGAGLDLMRFLAKHGALLHEQLIKRHPDLAEATFLNVLSRGATDYLPIEFVYNRPYPRDDASLCTKFASAVDAAIAATEAGEDAVWDCPECEAVGNPTKICPFGFWGLSRIIERKSNSEPPQPGTPPPAIPGRSAPTPSHPSLPVLDRAVFAASSRVDAAGAAGATPETQLTFEALSSLTTARRATTWDEWNQAVGEASPPLLVLIAHTDQDPEDKVGRIEIGKEQFLEIGELTQDLVQPAPADPGPVVFLLGCNTAQPEVGFHSFVARLCDLHASVVVGTVATVLGRHAAPVAREFVTELINMQRSGTGMFGDVLRRVRTNLVKAGNPMALTLAAYGDADWRLSA